MRNELKAKSSWQVRDVIVTIDQDTHELNRMIYGHLSNITHADLDSVKQTVRKTGDQSYEILMGVSLHGAHTLLNAAFASMSPAFHQTAALCLAVFNLV